MAPVTHCLWGSRGMLELVTCGISYSYIRKRLQLVSFVWSVLDTGAVVSLLLSNTAPRQTPVKWLASSPPGRERPAQAEAAT